MASNKNIVLIMGKPASGKSASLMGLKNQEKMIYLNTDLKELPFAERFLSNIEVADAMDVLGYIEQIESEATVEGAVLDTITFLMSMYERQYVANATNGQQAWGNYGNFYRELIHAIKAGSKDYAILAHEEVFHNETTHEYESKVPVKGSVGKTGVEADFTTVLSCKQLTMKELEDHENDLLHITDEEREDDRKYVFCTRTTGATKGEKMRSAIGLWNRNELYIDNDLDQVFARLREFYGTPKQEAA